jgi:tRNA-splicing ligase RtcB
MTTKQPRVEATRLDATRLRLATPSGIDITLFANDRVPVDRASLSETLGLDEIAAAVAALSRARFFGDGEAAVRRCVLTPDFHKGAGVPVGTAMDAVGFVVPRCPGTDIGCGMALWSTAMRREEFESLGGRLDALLRRAFFEGARSAALAEADRAAVLREGLPALRRVAGGPGLWGGVSPGDVDRAVARAHRGGSWPTSDLWAFGDFVRGSGGTSHDAALGSIGGGNHFVEVQWVEERADRRACWDWGLAEGAVTVMVHTGSVGLGSLVGKHFTDRARAVWPRGVPLPARGYLPLPTVGPLAAEGEAYLSAMGLAANFAAVNRFVLARLALRCLSEAAGRDVGGNLLWDSPHNLVWSDGQRRLHRKGACPALRDERDPVYPDGHPVVVPGSMGDASWVMRGLGSDAALCSAPHGAGRLSARGEGRKGEAGELDRLRVVTPVDPARVRRDVAAERARSLMEEAPSQYKPVAPVIDTVREAGVAAPVARLRPLLTVKG